MNKLIKKEQIEAVLQVIYQTNISAANFDAIRKLFTDLPDAEIKTTDTQTDSK